ncbi:hypothetical protein ABTY59_32035 [Streptomyces sp. NPDC096079]|uniref:hypothetical protein n=1 Tax=Streptomyces sp. NPDC096079 TaxID=3155820 RepID=UPI00332527CE
MATIPLPVDLTQLPDKALQELRRAAADELKDRNAAALPGTVLNALTADLLDVEVPRIVLAEFTTAQHENGYYWCDFAVEVTFDDGSTRTLDLSEHSALDEALVDHASWHEATINGGSSLRFAPGLPALIYKS